MQLLDGKVAAAAIKEKLQHAVNERLLAGKKTPHLAAILVGNNGASETYVASKVKNCAEVGFKSSLIRLPLEVTEAELLAEIALLNQNTAIDGILVQLPLPKHIDDSKIIAAIVPAKDVDGFHAVSVGRMVQGLDSFIPATPYGIMLLLEYFGVATTGKHAVVIGRSNIVGRPMSILLSSHHPQGNCTVTLCHSKTPNLESFTQQADIVVAALGKPGFLTHSMVKPGAVVIDVGITRVTDATKKSGFSIKGDVDFDGVAPKCSWITPVPGGVGLMTIGALLMNTLKAAEGLDSAR
ncbi:MAG: bifunctional 5,10-methylenetetrahydrofolate dehydrogenase/5,10-methenyltetrahydrofolate cyclohydrolase [Bacteroidetes bacterium]|nr:MAG: bifunctional 5,10-methylenetetrahydrofolate dehydrogenase/5,10-methenyltetrahydrofolate cyclohydrolase [Bacteroidota bacterium]